jgi:PGAP1-like protein
VRADELRAFGDLAGDGARGIANLARGVHEAVSARVFGALGPSAEPVRVAHDTIARASYATASALAGSLVRGGAWVGGLTRPADAPSIAASGRGRAVLAAVNGAWGDGLADGGSVLAHEMSVRQHGHEVALDRDSLPAAFTGATPLIAMFVHGLGESEDSWRRGSGASYGERLAAEHGFTPVHVRYNTGLHISRNGRLLASLLQRLIGHWPCSPVSLTLIGHSMGGLVIRSACHYGVGAEHRWPARVGGVFMLGAPHTGAPLERGAAAAVRGLSLLGETRPFAEPLRLRSAGIKDLRHGYLVDEDWAGRDPDAAGAGATELAFLPGADHYFLSATVSADPEAPSGRLLGDLLVLRRSAWSQRGRAERLRFDAGHYRNLGGANHFDLLNHPAVYEQISRWIDAGGARPAVPAQRP